ncbi:acyl-CoA thioesterase [Bdellovibrio sp. HCB185ZH]|uniref:acyl-CoA thioesterase n=1 Tax=Bdellovibrio sp. HCB185ZH TaxID=3394235 RepID=UPI0039A445F1
MGEFGSYKLLIRETHIDSYGHVNNATYLSLYEEARWEAITPRGFGFNDIHRLQQGPVILEVNIKFLKEIKLRENITIVSSIMDYEGKIGHMKQQMIKDDGTVASEAVFTFGLFDLKARKMILPTPEWKKACGLE